MSLRICFLNFYTIFVCTTVLFKSARRPAFSIFSICLHAFFLLLKMAYRRSAMVRDFSPINKSAKLPAISQVTKGHHQSLYGDLEEFIWLEVQLKKLSKLFFPEKAIIGFKPALLIFCRLSVSSTCPLFDFNWF